MHLDISNRSHRPAPYVEWWYFHFACTDGTTLNMVLHETDIFGIKTNPYLSLSIHQQRQSPHYLKRDLAVGTIATDSPYLHVGQQLLIEDTQRLCFHIPFSNGNCFSGEIHKLAAPLVLEGGTLYRNALDGRCSHWVVGIPHATFQAVLQLDGHSHVLSGFAYQDHQWGNILFQEWVSDWVWSHFSNEDTAVLFFQILTKQGQCIERVSKLTKQDFFSSTYVDSTYLACLQQQEQPQQLETMVTVPLQQEQLSFAIQPDNLMRTRLAEPIGQHCASYLRWATTAKLSTCDGQPLYGITEYIRLRPSHERVSEQQSFRNLSSLNYSV